LPSKLGGFTIPQQKTGEVPVVREQRKLAAIVAADVVGYSRLMGRDESGTLARLQNTREPKPGGVSVIFSWPWAG
jgi:hypothetical protein